MYKILLVLFICISFLITSDTIVNAGDPYGRCMCACTAKYPKTGYVKEWQIGDKRWPSEYTWFYGANLCAKSYLAECTKTCYSLTRNAETTEFWIADFHNTEMGRCYITSFAPPPAWVGSYDCN